MGSEIVWDNDSVLQFAGDEDPVKAMELRAQEVVLEAVDSGWSGPPFNPMDLARLRGIMLRPNASVADARIYRNDDGYVLDYNPNKSVGRVNFSIAHEIAHTFFEDCADKVRHRSPSSSDVNNWQLEMLCNIGAAEILMPVGSLEKSLSKPKPIESLMELRKSFHVSTEAMLIRMVKMARFPVICFTASKTKEDGYRLDYTIPSTSWRYGKFDRMIVDQSKCFDRCAAIGMTSKSTEKWAHDLPNLSVEAIGLPPYPGRSELRIAGFALPKKSEKSLDSEIAYLQGDASVFAEKNRSAIIHVVNNKGRSWGGFGFVRSLIKQFPSANKSFRSWATESKENLKLGNFHLFNVDETRYVASVVAQAGYGDTHRPRIRYGALHSALESLASFFIENDILDVQMPRVGAGQAGGNWTIIEGIIFETLVSNNINVRVYDLPPK